MESSLADGTKTEHVLYSTETQTRSHEEYDDGEYESVVAYTLTGVLEWEGVAYEMRGYRTTETEREDGEEETKETFYMIASDPADPSNYVRMDLETENEQERGEQGVEREYVYSVYRGGRLTERTSVDFETEREDGERETAYEIEVCKDGVRSSFAVERAERENGRTVIGVKYRTPEGSGRFVVTRAEDGSYVYAF